MDISKLNPEQRELAYKIGEAAVKKGLNPDFVLPMVMQESGFDNSLVSKKGAVGVMQIMPSTADMMWPEKDKINTAFLMNNINFNVETSMKLLKRLHSKYNDWSTVFGCYNTGRPCINEYAKNVYNYKPNFKN